MTDVLRDRETLNREHVFIRAIWDHVRSALGLPSVVPTWTNQGETYEGKKVGMVITLDGEPQVLTHHVSCDLRANRSTFENAANLLGWVRELVTLAPIGYAPLPLPFGLDIAARLDSETDKFSLRITRGYEIALDAMVVHLDVLCAAKP